MYVCMCVSKVDNGFICTWRRYKVISIISSLTETETHRLYLSCVYVYFNHNLILASGRYYMYLLLIISRLETNRAVSQVISRKTLCEKWIFSFLLLLLLLQPHQRHRTPAEVLTRGNNTLIKLPDKAQVEHIFFLRVSGKFLWVPLRGRGEGWRAGAIQKVGQLLITLFCSSLRLSNFACVAFSMQRPERFRKKLNKLQITKLPNFENVSKGRGKKERERGGARTYLGLFLSWQAAQRQEYFFFIFFLFMLTATVGKLSTPQPTLPASPVDPVALPAMAKSAMH